MATKIAKDDIGRAVHAGLRQGAILGGASCCREPRRCELVEQGRLEPTGERRKGQGRVSRTVWRVAGPSGQMTLDLLDGRGAAGVAEELG